MVIMLALYSDDPSSNPAEAYSFFCKSVCLKRTKINKIRGRGWPFLKKHIRRAGSMSGLLHYMSMINTQETVLYTLRNHDLNTLS